MLRDRIQALEQLMNRQKVVSNRPEDLDVLGLGQKRQRNLPAETGNPPGPAGRRRGIFLAGSGQQPAEILSAFILQHYPDAALVPPEILVPESLPDEES